MVTENKNRPIKTIDLTTRLTETLEQINKDEIKADSTVFTFTVEASDEDEITTALCSTIETRVIEPADTDEIRNMSTLQTNTLENWVGDEILLN